MCQCVIICSEGTPVIGCSSFMLPPCSTDPPCVHQCDAWDTWTATFPPTCVDSSTIPWPRGTCYSLVTVLFLRSTGTRHPRPISPQCVKPHQTCHIWSIYFSTQLRQPFCTCCKDQKTCNTTFTSCIFVLPAPVLWNSLIWDDCNLYNC